MSSEKHLSRREFLKYLGLSSASLVLSTYSTPVLADLFNSELKNKELELKIDINLTVRPSLEEIINSQMNEFKLEGLIEDDEKTAWLIYDLENNEKIVGINDKDKIQAASMVKPYVALAFFQKVDENRVRYTNKIKRKIAAMIQHSNNDATNTLIKLLGGPKKVNAILQQNYDFLENTQIVETIPKGGKTYANSSSAEDYNNFLRALWYNVLPFSNEIKRNMALAGKSRIYAGTTIPEETKIYNKTGTTAMLCGDMAIFNALSNDGRRKAYTLIGIIEKENKAENYIKWKKERSKVIRQVSQLTYDFMKERHNLI